MIIYLKTETALGVKIWGFLVRNPNISIFYFRKYPEKTIYDGCMSIILANGTVVSQNAGEQDQKTN
jgi:hypothetical protein